MIIGAKEGITPKHMVQVKYNIDTKYIKHGVFAHSDVSALSCWSLVQLTCVGRRGWRGARCVLSVTSPCSRCPLAIISGCALCCRRAAEPQQPQQCTDRGVTCAQAAWLRPASMAGGIQSAQLLLQWQRCVLVFAGRGGATLPLISKAHVVWSVADVHDGSPVKRLQYILLMSFF